MIRHTSRLAGKSVRGSLSRAARASIFKSLVESGQSGLTIEEIVSKTGIKLQTVCARRKELEDKGLIRNSGQKRNTESGRTAIVWIVPGSVIAKLNARASSKGMNSIA